MNSNSSVCVSESKKKSAALIAGEGQLPLMVAEQASRAGHPLTVYSLSDSSEYTSLKGIELISLMEETPSQDAGEKKNLMGLNLGAIMEDMTRRGIQSVTLAGVVPKKIMYRASLDPSLRALISSGDNDDHSLLGRIVTAFESVGLPVIPYTSILADALAPEGLIAGRGLSDREKADVECGIKILAVTLPLSFGQSLVVSNGAVVAIEAMEGTDAMIRRAGDILSSARGLIAHSEEAGGVLVKMMRHDQDERYDIPVVGVDTLENMSAAGLTTLAVEAGRTLLIEPEAFRERASLLGISVIGVSEAARRFSGGARP